MQIASKWPVVRALKTVDALGDVTAYAGKVARLPGKSAEIVRSKVGHGAPRAEHAAHAGRNEADLIAPL